MRAYIIRRLLLIVPSLFILSMLVFLSVRFIPGDAIDAMMGKQGFIGAEVDREALEHMLGLDVPVHVQYGRWIGGILRHGSLMLTALEDRDYPVVSGVNLFFATAVVLFNLLIDLLYTWLDPRVRYE